LVQLAHPAGDAKEILHHMLNRLVAFAFVTQATGDAELPVEQQAIIVAVELQMQRKANAPQLMQAFVKLVALGFGQKPKPTISSSEVAPKWRRAIHCRV
jgi:hypothetical protein